MTVTQEPNELILLPSLKAQHGPSGGLVMTQKYMNGAEAFARGWPGPVTSLVNLDDTPTTDMDHVEVLPGAAGTALEIRPADPAALAKRLQKAAVVLAFLSRDEAATSAICQQMGVPIVFTSEYSPQTEREIVDAQTANPVLRMRRKLWIARTERIRRHLLTTAAGLQCSGTPTHDIYHPLHPHHLLFFDNRVPAEQVMSDADFQAKADAVASGRPLRLVFGGRLVEMKGVLELPNVALALRQQGVPFSFDIYGSGPLEAALTAQIAALGLSDQVTLRGALDFETGWIPALKADADLFVCCHLQGDPSSTYPEVLSCGVPIVGYDNEALRGIVTHSHGGWTVAMHDAGQLAARIAELHRDRAELTRAAQAGRAFARLHAFEPTMARRAAHLVRASRLEADRKADAVRIS